MNKMAVTAMLAAIASVASHTALAQSSDVRIVGPSYNRGSDDDAPPVRRDLRSLKKQIIAANVELTDEEAQAFWPIYDRYTAEWTPLMDRKFELMKDYAENFATLTDDQADAYIRGRAEVEGALLSLRLAYLPVFRKALSAKTAALFIQLDWRMSLFIDMQLASQTSLIEL